MSEKVLVVGNNVRNVAESARKAGFEVYATTKFADADLSIYCKETLRLGDELAEREIAEIVEAKAEEIGAKIVLCSGFETLNVKRELLCNEPGICEKVADKLKFYMELEKAGLPFPELLSDDGEGIVKPRKGGGGEEVGIARNTPEGCIKQRFIEGLPCSVSLIAYEGKSIPIACNMMYAGWKEMNAEGFRYSGNLTPLQVSKDTRQKLEKLAVEAVELFDLTGSVGVDFILAEKPYILEINPRFQGSLDSIEWSCDVNVFRMHAKAFERLLPEKCRPKRVAIRSILFSPSNVTIKESLSGNPFFADVPNVNDFYQKNDPLVSILASGNSKEEVEQKILKRRDFFLKLQGLI